MCHGIHCSVPTDEPRRLIIAITGATGAIYGIRMLEILRRLSEIEIHLLISSAGWLNIQHELQLTKNDMHRYAHVIHSVRDVSANVASGSFLTAGMIVAPCSMKTLASIAHGLSDNLISRAADVTLKERRRLILLTRETPLNLIHLQNMTTVTKMGGVIFPPMPAFYNQPVSLNEIIDYTVTRVLDLFALGIVLSPSWSGFSTKKLSSKNLQE